MGGLFTYLIEAGLYHGEHPLRGLSKLKTTQTEMAYMSQAEIAAVLADLQGDDKKIAMLYLSTGARWGEAYNLKAEHVIGNRVTFVKTKNGKHRTIPVSDEVAQKILGNGSGFLFPKANYQYVREVLKRVKPDLPNLLKSSSDDFYFLSK